MTATNHDYDRLIKEALKNQKRLSVNKLWKKTGIPHGTFFSHFNNLKKEGQIEPEEDPSWKKSKRRFYRLTESTKLKRRWGFEERIISRREPKNSSLQRTNENEKMKKVILLLLLSQAAKGSGRLKPATDLKAGQLYVHNPITQKSERCEYFEEKGVTTNDVIEHKDVGNDGAFAHVNFTEADVEDCLKTLKEYELSNVLTPISREGDENITEIPFEINDGLLRDIIRLCVCIIHQVATRIEYYWLYRRRRRRPAQGPDFEWYVSFFGEKRTDDLIKRAKIKRARVQDAERIIKQCDKEIIRLYHERILCDKYKLMPAECIHDYEKYRKFVKNMPQNYHFLVDTLIEVIYPPFLRKLHNTDPELLEFTKSLRDEPAISLK